MTCGASPSALRRCIYLPKPWKGPSVTFERLEAMATLPESRAVAVRMDLPGYPWVELPEKEK